MIPHVTPLMALLACKAIGLVTGLSSSARRVGCAIIDHFNRRNGQCDPSVERLARLLGLNVRTVLRAVDDLDRRGLILKVRHGGYSQRNSYRPNWALFEDLTTKWRSALKGTELSADHDSPVGTNVTKASAE